MESDLSKVINQVPSQGVEVTSYLKVYHQFKNMCVYKHIKKLFYHHWVPCSLPILVVMNSAKSLAAWISSMHQIPNFWAIDWRYFCLGLPHSSCHQSCLSAVGTPCPSFLTHAIWIQSTFFFILPNSLLVILAQSNTCSLVMCHVHDIPRILLRNDISVASKWLHFRWNGTAL